MHRCPAPVQLCLLSTDDKKSDISIKKRKMWCKRRNLHVAGFAVLISLHIFGDMEMKQLLKKIVPGVMFCFTTASCALVEIGAAQKDEQNGVWNGPAVQPPASAQSVSFVSAFDYPEGYDWRADPERGEVKCSLVVFREGIPVLKVPVGDEYLTGSDPDMHRIIDGHLYTDFSTDSETIIKKDGKPLFSYPKPEMICDFQVRDGNVHTLGHSRSGQGFSYRINGEPVLERESGYTYERILFEDSQAVIAFSEPITSSEGVVERHYVMRDGKVMQVAVRDDIKKVWDVSYQNGEVCYLASLAGVSTPVLVSGQKIMAMSMPAALHLVSIRMNVLSSGIYAEGVLSDQSQLHSILWSPENRYVLFPKGATFSAVCRGEDAMHYAVNPAAGKGTGLIYRAGESLDMPSGYACMSRQAIDFSAGILSVGLSSLSGGKPVLWVDGQLKELDVNGYVCSVSSQTL